MSPRTENPDKDVMKSNVATRETPLVAPDTACESAAKRMYDAEVALHCARQTHVDAWIAAAYEQLHVAVEAYVAASEFAERAPATSRLTA
jgi:hypothetical protein